MPLDAGRRSIRWREWPAFILVAARAAAPRALFPRFSTAGRERFNSLAPLPLTRAASICSAPGAIKFESCADYRVTLVPNAALVSQVIK